MKIKSHTSKWAMALCALAVFSFTAQAAIVADIQPPGPTIMPTGDNDNDIIGGTIRPRIEPLPPIQPPVDSGTFNGTVMD